jgi:CubicO group peptidase (beta-lactamase class C family)
VKKTAVRLDADVKVSSSLSSAVSGSPPAADHAATATKGLAAMTLAVAHSRGWPDYDERVCTYWPEFAQQGKERITVRQGLAHQAGLFAINEPVDRTAVADLIHLLGAAKAFGWADLPQLTQPISPAAGALWLVSAGLFLATAGSLFLWPRWWWLLGAAAVVLSMAVIVPV